MKSKLIALSMIIFMSGTHYVFADADEGMMGHKMGETAAKAVEVGNKICPVSGNPADDGTMGETVKYEYNGKIYNLCCKMCVKDFKRDPEKYSKIAEEEVKEADRKEDGANDKDASEKSEHHDHGHH